MNTARIILAIFFSALLFVDVPVAAANVKACAVIQHKGKGTVRAVAGSYEKRNKVTQLTKKLSPKWRSIGGGKYKAVFCVPRANLHTKVVTIVGANGHYTLRGTETNFFRTQSPGPDGPFGKDDVMRMWSGG